MAARMILTDFILAYPEWFPTEDMEKQETEQVNNDLQFREYVLNALKNLVTKKTLTIVVGNSNPYAVYSALSGKSEAAKYDFGFMDIKGYKFLFIWLSYPRSYMPISLRNIYLIFSSNCNIRYNR
jgi:hypothetical protein